MSVHDDELKIVFDDEPEEEVDPAFAAHMERVRAAHQERMKAKRARTQDSTPEPVARPPQDEPCSSDAEEAADEIDVPASEASPYEFQPLPPKSRYADGCNWLLYSGCKYTQLAYLDQFPIPQFDEYVEPFHGSAILSLYWMDRIDERKTFRLNDLNSTVSNMLKMLITDGVDALFNYDEWRNYHIYLRYGEGNSKNNTLRPSVPNWDRLRGVLEHARRLLLKHDIMSTNLD
jgi:hypothetical protein